MKEDVKDIKGQVSQTIATLMTTAFGLIAALAWNEAITPVLPGRQRYYRIVNIRYFDNHNSSGSHPDNC